MQNEVCHKTGQLYAKVAYRNTQVQDATKNGASSAVTGYHFAHWHDGHTDFHGNY